MVEQLLLWENSRVPDAFVAHFKAHGTCSNCRQPLRHYVHAYNHWRKCHAKTVKLTSRSYYYFAWNGNVQRWQRVDRENYLRIKAEGFSTAKTLGVDLSKVQ